MSMSEKLLDPQGRQRSKTISFRMSPEEAEVLDSLVAASGMTKQDYITSCLIDHRITVIPHTRTYKGLYDEMGRVYRELRRIKRDGHVSADLERIIGALAEEFAGLGDEPSEVEKEDAAVRALKR